MTGAIAAVVASTGALSTVASAAAFTILVYYGIANVAALRLPPKDRLYSPFIPIFGLTGCIVLALSLPLRVMIVGLITLLAGVVFRLLFRR